MSYINFEQGKNFFYDKTNTKILLADLVTSEINHSKLSAHQFNPSGGISYPLTDDVYRIIKKFPNGSMQSVADAMIIFRVLDKLLRKPQIHNVLYVGAWSVMCEVIHELIPKFNDKNYLYVLSNTRPIENFNHAKFIFTEGEKYFLPENRFSTIIFSEMNVPPAEVILSAKNFGYIYFLCNVGNVSEDIKSHSRIFEFENNFAVFELETSPELKNIISQSTELGAVGAKKSEISRIVLSVPASIKKYNLRTGDKRLKAIDKLIADLIVAEKKLAEIFPYLMSDTIKFNLNLLKEYLIDFRLRMNEPNLQKISAKKIADQYKILIEDFRKDFS